jgi:hypothetical protein
MYFCFSVSAFGDVTDIVLNHLVGTDVINVADKLDFNTVSALGVKRNVAALYELGAPRSSYHAIFGPLYPVYFRGEALLALHQGPQAAAEFQKVLDHRSLATGASLRFIRR